MRLPSYLIHANFTILHLLFLIGLQSIQISNFCLSPLPLNSVLRKIQMYSSALKMYFRKMRAQVTHDLEVCKIIRIVKNFL